MPFYGPAIPRCEGIAPDAHTRPLWGDKVMMGYITLEPAVEVPPTHPPELAGMRLEDETCIVRQDDFCLGPSSIAGTPLWIASSPGLLHRLL